MYDRMYDGLEQGTRNVAFRSSVEHSRLRVHEREWEQSGEHDRQATLDWLWRG